MLKSLPLDDCAFTLALGRLLPKSRSVPASFWAKNPDHALMVFGANKLGPHPFVIRRLSLNKKRKVTTAILWFTSEKCPLSDKSLCLRVSRPEDIEKINRTLIKKKIQEVIVIIELSVLAYPYALHPKDETGKLAPHEIAIALNSIPKEVRLKLGCLCDGKINEFSKTESAATENVAVLQTAASLASLLLESLRQKRPIFPDNL
jgi:hypothetical protein